MTWDGAGRLTGVSGGGLSTSNASTYNGLDQRVAKTDSTGAYGLVLADDAIDSPVVADGSATYQHGRGLVSETRSSATKFFHLDSLGTARALTDGSGTKTDGLETDTFGLTVSTVGTPLGARPFGFAAGHGYQTDSDTGLQRLGHRFYDPSTGRFLSRDPARAGYNWYTYCENDPVNDVDPEGHWKVEAIAAPAVLRAAPVFVVPWVGLIITVVVVIVDEAPAGAGEQDYLDRTARDNYYKYHPIENARKQSKKSGKERATDKPSWVNQHPPKANNESCDDYARRLMDEKYGQGNWQEGPGSEFSKIKKWCERS